MIKPIEVEYSDDKGHELTCALCEARATNKIESSQTPLCDSHATAFEWGITNAEEKASKENEGKFAKVTWSAEDIIKVAPHLTREDAEYELSNMESDLEKVMIERGWGYIEYALPDTSEPIECEYTSEWDCGTVLTTKAEYAPNTKDVFFTEVVTIEGLNSCIREYITLPNGIVMDVEDEEVLVETRKETLDE